MDFEEIKNAEEGGDKLKNDDTNIPMPKNGLKKHNKSNS